MGLDCGHVECRRRSENVRAYEFRGFGKQFRRLLSSTDVVLSVRKARQVGKARSAVVAGAVDRGVNGL